jgi:metal-responsive CopG/Arc/MetJ family transcriptional regulator
MAKRETFDDPLVFTGFRLPARFLDAVDQAAEVEGTSRSGWIRQALADRLERTEAVAS